MFGIFIFRLGFRAVASLLLRLHLLRHPNGLLLVCQTSAHYLVFGVLLKNNLLLNAHHEIGLLLLCFGRLTGVDADGAPLNFGGDVGGIRDNEIIDVVFGYEVGNMLRRLLLIILAVASLNVLISFPR